MGNTIIKSKKTLLWENTDTSIAFASTTLLLDLSQYSYIEIEYVLYAPEGFLGSPVSCRVGAAGALIDIGGSASAMSGVLTGGRRNFSTTGISIYFSGGMVCADGGSWFAQDAHCVPYRIWGIK